MYCAAIGAPVRLAGWLDQASRRDSQEREVAQLSALPAKAGVQPFSNRGARRDSQRHRNASLSPRVSASSAVEKNWVPAFAGKSGFACQALKFSFSPGRGQRALNSLPVDEQVTQAVRMSSPPKQML